MHFYEIGGLLLRRWIPGQRRLAMEAWMGDGWAPYQNVDHVLRYGRRVGEAEAVSLLQSQRATVGTLRPFAEEEAQSALRDRRLRSTALAHR